MGNKVEKLQVELEGSETTERSGGRRKLTADTVKITLSSGATIEVTQSMDYRQFIIRSGRNRMAVVPVANNAIELSFFE